MARSSFTFGLVFIALGVLLLLDRAGQVDTWQLVAEWWPVVVILAGAAQVLTRPRNLVGGVIIGTIGGVLLLWTLGYTDVVALMWPLLLIGLGLWLLTRRGARWRKGSGAVHFVDAEEIVLVFGDRNVRVPAGPYGGQEITTVFGDLGLDLSDTRIEGRVTVPVTTIFGDVEIVVPPDWRVTVSGPELFGDVTATSPTDLPDSAPELHLQVVCIFGDIEVRSRARIATSPG
jgi:hypothetical protein